MVSAMMRLAMASGSAPSKPVAHLDAHAPVVLRDEQDRAVVDALAAELPRVRDADAVLLDFLGLRRRHDEHGDLAALLGLESRRASPRCD